MSRTEKKDVSKISGFLSCRQVLNLLVILGFMLNYALRVNLTIAIVDMAEPVHKTNGNITIDYQNTTNNSIETILNVTESKVDSLKFQWSESQQNIILGCFYWGYILTELPGGRLAELIGGRRVFGHSMLWASVLTLVTPFAANISYVALIIVRMLLGFMLGASWPAIHPMTAVWIPPMERSKFMSNMMASSLGAAIAMPVCGFLIASVGWGSVFYATGGVGLLWSIAWFLFVFETPAAHPRISPEEKREIEEAIGGSTSKKRPSYVPWKQLLLSPPVWAIVITHGCSVFAYFTVVNQLPTFMAKILGFQIKANGLLSSLPYLGKYLMAIAASALADYLRQSGKLSTTAIRKSFTAFAVFTPGVMMVIQIFVGSISSWSVAIFTISLTLNGAVTAGYLGNGLDIAPNFSGTIFGMANTLSSAGGFLSAYMVGALTDNNQTMEQWKIIFMILAVVYFVGSLAYVIMGSGELQPWNNPDEQKNGYLRDAEEAVPLDNKTIKA